jgi:hypothetical protein
LAAADEAGAEELGAAALVVGLVVVVDEFELQPAASPSSAMPSTADARLHDDQEVSTP